MTTQNLDSLRSEIESYLTSNDFVVFHGYSRRLEESPLVEWDTLRHPDFKAYLAVARQLGVKVVVFHHREFAAGVIEDAVDDLEMSYGYDEDGSLRRRLNELRVYEGFTCAIEMSFAHEGTLYLWEALAPWYEEYRDIRDEIDMVEGIGPEGDDESDDDDRSLGGYYSKN